MKFLPFLFNLLFFSAMGQNRLQPDSFIFSYGNLHNSLNAILHKKKCTVAFLGGSITQNPGWKDKVVQYLEDEYPATHFTFLYAGIASLGSVPHSFRLQRDVLDNGIPDLLFLEAAVNDHANKTPPEHQQRAMEGIIRHALSSSPAMNIIVMAFADEDKTADYEAGKIPQEVALHNSLAQHYRLPFINLAKEVQQRIKNKEFTWKDDFKDLHPSPFGQQLYFETIKTLLEKEKQSYNKKERLTSYTPGRSIVPGVYDRGRYANVTEATDLNGFAVTENWKPADKAPTRPGFTEVPVLESSTPGSTLRFSFSGTAVGIAIVSGPDAGRIRYSVDGMTAKTLNLRTEWSNQLHLPWYLVLADNLKNGKHDLAIELLPPADGFDKSACRIVHFLVNGE
ncbi:MAG: hypothetical protein KIT80_09255 [Chitinophagaceae bacterium]|nr:hypothetical protein [Chitinophagaceae bacterium]MCW5927085.1 hypothetical protein [Chitinophagaceae bacterium]